MTIKKRHVIGLMSGTSLDGVDLVYVAFNTSKQYDFKIISSETIQYTTLWKQKLQNAFSSTEDEIQHLDVEYGNYLGNLIKDFVAKNDITEIDFIASHGHTIFHKPAEGYTLQIGNGQSIVNISNTKVICDFRTQDVKLGGQGAPLVPIGDELLFSDFDYCLNLGGFANISFKEKNKRLAFDICPVNIVLNYYVNKLGFEYDDKGKIASKGAIHQELLTSLNGLDFYAKSYPKSLGFEWIESTIIPLIHSFNIEIQDILRTFVEHAAIQISNVLKKETTLLITGGGAYNTFLISRLRNLTAIEIEIPNDEIINYKEALIFGLLGLLKSESQINVLSSVTGAKKDHSSGVIFEPQES